ncbi:MAG: type II CRISPR-associated endonuclease Cas1 [Magnetococcales bacterium]|nr:type II CRISPR-associated endonuclease Cas1 [Magnetococcales bacterium]
MIKKVVEVASPARLSVRHQQLLIERGDDEAASIPCEDIGILLVEHPAVTYTHGVFVTLNAFGAVIIFCGPDHLPAGIVLPAAGHHESAARIGTQVEASLPLKKGIWKTTIRAKLCQQAALLAERGEEGGALLAMAGRVRSGDSENLEAQAARRYWPLLMGPDFRRERGGAPPNHLLNYGYMVFRAAMARALTAAGLLPALGVNHHAKRNTFALADDLGEPYRPLVDWRVRQMVDAGEGLDPALNRPQRAALLALFNETVRFDGERLPLLAAMGRTAVSLVRCFAEKRTDPIFPEGMPLPPDGATDDADT